MTKPELPRVVSYNFAVVQPARGLPGIGLSLHLLLRGDAGGETRTFLQLEKRQVWVLRDACAAASTDHPDQYASFLAKTRAAHQLNYGDKFLKTLPSTDPYANFHRRWNELAIPAEFLTAMHPAQTGVLSTATLSRGGMVCGFMMKHGETLAFFLPDDLAFQMVDTIDQAVWAAEWERDERLDDADS